MNTLYVLKGGMKFKFLALTVVFLLGFSAGNSAWGQSTIDNGTDVALDWHTGSSWSGGSSPNLAADNLNIQIVDDMVGEVGLTFTGTNRPSQFRVLSGKTLRIKGDLIFQNGCNQLLIENNAKVIIEGDLIFQNTSNATVQPGGSLVIHGNASLAANLTLDGNFLVSGDLTYSANALTVNPGGTVVVGNNFNVSNNVALGNGGYIGVFGDLTQGGGNFNNGSGGELVVLGELTGCSGCNSGTVLESDDPVWNIVWGINSLYWEDFVAGNTKGGYSILNGYGVISGDRYTFNNTTAGLDAVVWESVNRSADCNDRLKVTYDLVVTNGGSSTVKLQYSVDGGTVWQDVPAGNFPARQVKLRLIVEDLPSGATVTLDNIHVSGTNEGGTPADLIVWGERALVVCPTEIASYTIANGHVYSSILWEVVSGGAIQGAANKSVCLVQWTGGIMRLKVTVTGGSCGPSSQQVVEEFDIAESDRLRLSITHFKAISCNGDNNGELTVAGQCSPNNGEVLTYDWITNNGVSIPQNTTALTDLIPGEYSVTVKGATSGQEDTKTITLIDPEVLAVTFTNLNNFLCAGHEGEGSFTVVPTGGTSPYTVAINGTPYPDPVGWAFINLSNGTYNIVVTDAHGCVATSEVVVQLDNVAPTFTAFPANVQMTMAEYLANTGSKLTTTTSNLTGGILSAPSALTITPILPSLSGLHNLELSFTVSQSPVSSDNADVFYVEMTTDGSNWNSILTDQNSLNNGSVTIPLGENADGNTNLGIRFRAEIATGGLQYTVSNVQITGSRFTVSPPTCNDNSSVCSVSYTDSKPKWSSCSGYSNPDAEFYIERNWTAVDACGNSTPRKQIISVGTAPTFNNPTFPVDKVYDFCHNNSTSITQTAPDITNSGTCGAANISWKVVRETSPGVYDEINGGSANGTGNFESYSFDFPANTNGETSEDYYIVWTVTDQSFNKAERMQKITIKPAIAFDYFQIASSENICQNEEVTINLKPKGGTGVFDLLSFVPDVTSPDVLGATSWEAIGAGVYQCKVRFGTTASARTFTITVTDRNVGVVTGGCPASLVSAPFDVHDLIPTGSISRD